MKQWRGDINIGYRAYEEVLRIFPGTTAAMRGLGIRHKNLYAWGEGVNPSAKYLARLHKAGADVIWILTGEKSNTRKETTRKKVGM